MCTSKIQAKKYTINVVSLKSDHAVSLTLSRHCPLLTIRSYPQQDSALVRIPGQLGAGGGYTQFTVLNSIIGQGSLKPPFCWQTY